MDFKQYIARPVNIFKVIMLVITLLLLFVVLLGIGHLFISQLLLGDDAYVPYKWNNAVCLLIPLVIILLILRGSISDLKEEGNVHALNNWKIAGGLVVFIILLSLGNWAKNQFLSSYGRQSPRNLKEFIDNLNDRKPGTYSLKGPEYDSFWEDVEKVSNNNLLQWRTSTSLEGGFTIKFPDFEVKKSVGLKTNSQGKQVPVGRLSMDLQNELDNNLFYGVSYTTIAVSEDVNSSIDDQRNAILKESKADITDEIEADTLPYKARDIYAVIQKEEKAVAIRIIAINEKLYTLLVVTNYSNRSNAAIPFFFNSIEFTE